MDFYRTWAEERGRLARSLGQGDLGGSYADGAIILCAAISAMSSLLWEPTERTDRKRFIEIVARLCSGGPDTTRVSASLLAVEFPQLGKHLGISEKSLYLTGGKDKTEAEAISICGTAGVSDCTRSVRRYSYASLLYEQVRCGFIHEYKPGKQATGADALRGIAGVRSNHISYVNSLTEENNLMVARRLIHFPLEWISEVALAVATAMDGECSRQSKYPSDNLGLKVPTRWWSEGG